MMGKDEHLCAEYALGTLRGEDRARFEARLAGDPALRRDVAAWERRLEPLAREVAPVEPSPDLWSRIEAGLGTDNVVPIRRRASWWNEPAPWRWATAASLAGLIALGIATLPDRDVPVLTASLVPPQTGGGFQVSYDPRNGELSLAAIGTAAPGAGQDYELWLVPANAAPVSLGVLPREGRLRVDPARAALDPGATLAVSLEPAGGSPTGQPTGPVLFVGTLGG